MRFEDDYGMEDEYGDYGEEMEEMDMGIPPYWRDPNFVVPGLRHLLKKSDSAPHLLLSDCFPEPLCDQDSMELLNGYSTSMLNKFEIVGEDGQPIQQKKDGVEEIEAYLDQERAKNEKLAQ